MKTCHLLAAAILALGLSPLSHAEIEVKARPITLSAGVGNEQDDFFFTKNTSGYYVVFSGAVPIARNNVSETRKLLSLKMSDGVATYFTGVQPGAPLKALASFKVAKGARFDNFQRGLLSGSYTDRAIFRVPGRGLYMTTSNRPPVLLHVDTATAPVTGAAMRFPENATVENPRVEAFRVLFGATFPKKGVEPYISTGAAKGTKLLKDLIPGKPGSNASQFTALNREVYFVATNPATQGIEVYKVVASGQAPTFAPVSVTPNFGQNPQQLTGSGAGLFYTTVFTGDPRSYLVQSADGLNYFFVETQAGANIFDATQLTPSITDDDNIGFSALDSATNKRRFGSYNKFNDLALFPEFPNTTPGTTTDPVRITSTDNHYFFGGTYTGAQFLMRWFTGGSTLEFVLEDSSGFGITNVGEIAWIKATGGSLYFTGDAFIDNQVQPGILFKMDPNASAPRAVACKTEQNNYIKGARNLHAVTDGGTIFRLYFTAPVSPTVNAEFATDGKDHGTKPWVVTIP